MAPARVRGYTGDMHDVVDPYPRVPKPLDALERSLQRLQEEMARRRARDAAIATAEEIIQGQAVKDPLLAAKQARLLAVLKTRVDPAAPTSTDHEPPECPGGQASNVNDA